MNTSAKQLLLKAVLMDVQSTFLTKKRNSKTAQAKLKNYLTEA
jgi:hypothetical protein